MGEALDAGAVITKADIDTMMRAQGMSGRGIMQGDAVFIHTGWGERWSDPTQDQEYYSMGPGLGYDAAQYLGEQGVALVSLDNPFTDPVSRDDGKLDLRRALRKVCLCHTSYNLSQAEFYRFRIVVFRYRLMRWSFCIDSPTSHCRRLRVSSASCCYWCAQGQTR